MREPQLRNYIRKIIREQAEEPQTTSKLKGALGGSYKKELRDLKEVPAGELMTRLKAKKAIADKPITNLVKFLESARGGVEAMKIVYGSPIAAKDSHGREGARIPLKSIKGGGGAIPAKDGRRYIELTMKAAVGTNYVKIPDHKVEIIGSDILVYFSKKKYAWNRVDASTKKKKSANEAVSETDLLGEPDLSQEDERTDVEKDKDEFNVTANVAGVVTPLGTGPDGGKGKKKKSSPRERAIDANERAFGGGKVYSPKKKK